MLFTGSLQQAGSQEACLSLYQANLTFLDNRYLEDYYYLKDVISLVDARLKKAGFHNVYDLDMKARPERFSTPIFLALKG